MRRAFGTAILVLVTVLACTDAPPRLVQGTRLVYILSGIVSDGVESIEGARVSVIDGPSAGVAMDTVRSGAFALTVEPGTMHIQSQALGYVTQTETVTVATDDYFHRLNFMMAADPALAQIDGTYTMTVTAAPTCTMLPTTATARSYSATITQHANRVDVSLGGADFYAFGFGGHAANQFSGRVGSNGAIFSLGLDYYLTDGVLERLDTERLFGLSGTATLDLTGGNLTGPLAGVLAIYDGASLNRTVMCTSDSHRLSFIRNSAATTVQSRRNR